MNNFFERNKIFLAIIISGVIIAGSIYFTSLNLKFPKQVVTKSGKPSKLNSPTGYKLVTKVIDGDTVIIEGGHTIRLLGIDADERGYSCYETAKKRLEELVLNKKVRLERDKVNQDQYQRFLRYLFLDNKNINLQLVKEGLAVVRFSPQNKKYRKEFIQAEKQAIADKVGCKWSGEIESFKISTQIRWKKLTPELTGLKVVDALNAGNYLGKEVIVEGRVVDAYRYRANAIFLNLEKPHPNSYLTAVIWSSDWYKFVPNPEEYYLNKIVRIKGKVKKYKGKPEIILKTPNQIEVGR